MRKKAPEWLNAEHSKVIIQAEGNIGEIHPPSQEKRGVGFA